MFSKAVTKAALAVAVLAVSTFAQTVRTTQFKIPFDFKVGAHQCVAGNYEVMAGAGAASIWVRNLDNQTVVSILTNAAESTRPQEKSALVFHKYGDEYFLNRIWLSNTYAGRELAPSRLEREMARNVKAGAATTIAASKAGR
ncbi:MAG: hypothetical protein IT158_19395 [Bryobacterales bacterium]|nr:hypothetical protein [Bryobacterales bacterium]